MQRARIFAMRAPSVSVCAMLLFRYGVPCATVRTDSAHIHTLTPCAAYHVAHAVTLNVYLWVLVGGIVWGRSARVTFALY